MATDDDSKQDYKDFLRKLLSLVIGPSFVLYFFYLAYNPVSKNMEVEVNFDLNIGDIILLVFLPLMIIFLISLSIPSLRPTNICKKLITCVKSWRNIKWENIKSYLYNKYSDLLIYVPVVVVAVFVWKLHSSPDISLDKIFARMLSEHELINLRNFLIGLVSIIGLALAGWRSHVAHKQVKVMEDNRDSDKKRRLDERFNDSVKLLTKGPDETNYPAHLAAISELRNIAMTSSDNTQRCLDIICSCNDWMEEYLEKFINQSVSSLIGKDHCYADRRLTEEDRIAKESKTITLYHERRSKAALRAISDILSKVPEEQRAEVDFSHKMLCGINLNRAELNKINLNNAYLIGADLNESQMRGANLYKARMQGAFLVEAQMRGANLYKARMQGAFLVEAQMQGAELPLAQMQRADLAGAQMQGANLKSAQMQGANLAGAQMQGADLAWAQMQGTNLYKAQMQVAELPLAQMQGANLKSAQMQGATLYKTKMQGAILLCSNLYSTHLEDIKVDSILFDKISKEGHPVGKAEREKQLKQLRQKMSLLDPELVKDIITRIENAWDKTDEYEDEDEVLAGLQKFKDASMLKENDDDTFSIKSEKRSELKKCYKDILSALSEDDSKDNQKNDPQDRKKFIERIIEILEVIIKNRKKGLNSNTTFYVEVYQFVREIWEELLAEEGSKK